MEGCEACCSDEIQGWGAGLEMGQGKEGKPGSSHASRLWVGNGKRQQEKQGREEVKVISTCQGLKVRKEALSRFACGMFDRKAATQMGSSPNGLLLQGCPSRPGSSIGQAM